MIRVHKNIIGFNFYLFFINIIFGSLSGRFTDLDQILMTGQTSNYPMLDLRNEVDYF